jgi:hypothetical protein
MSEDTLQADYRKALEEHQRAEFNPWNPLLRKRRFNLLVNQHVLRLNLARLDRTSPEKVKAPALPLAMKVLYPRVWGGPLYGSVPQLRLEVGA